MITVDALTRSYGDFKAVDKVSFSIARGEVVGLLGHNGAGKTTIMKMLTGFLEPDAGRIDIDGVDIRSQRRCAQQRIGYLPENCPLYPEMTIIDYLDYQAGLHGVPALERPTAIARAIHRTELAPKAAQPISTLSRGYRQRVGVAQAILHGPKILILDEPTNGLDPSQIQHMRALITDLARNATVILSTHIMQEVQAMCDRVLIIRHGRLALDARLAELGRSRQLRVSCDAEPKRFRALLESLSALERVEPIEQAAGRFEYLVTTDRDDPGALAPSVAKAVLDGGCQLFALQPRVRDLEAVFGEVNAVNRGEVVHG